MRASRRMDRVHALAAALRDAREDEVDIRVVYGLLPRLCLSTHAPLSSCLTPQTQNRAEPAWHDAPAAPIFRFTAAVFPPGWRDGWRRSAPSSARPSCITMAATNFCGGCRIRSGF